MRRSNLLSLALCFSVAVNCVLAYRWADANDALNDRGSEIARRAAQTHVISALHEVLLAKATRAQISAAAIAAKLEVIDKGKTELDVGPVEFDFAEDGRVTKIEFD